MSINRCLQRENRGRENELWEMKKTFFISAGFTSVKMADVDGL
jgi:hypothetical protein